MAQIIWKRRNVLIFASLCALIVAALCLVNKYIVCSSSTSIAQIEDLCSLYFAGELTGDLCHSLCSEKLLTFHRCLNINQGKVVLQMSWNRSYFVTMKSKHASLHEFLGFDFRKISRNNPLQVPSPSIFIERIADLVRLSFGQSINVSAAKLWNIREADDVRQMSHMTTLWLLLQQDEYLITSYFQGYPGIPELYGNCGFYYFMEFLPPGRHLSSRNFLSNFFSADWTERASLTVQLMNIMMSFYEDFHEPFHFCDMKGLNFGVDLNGNLKAIDLDMAVFENFLLSRYNQLSCTDDSDCDFFDCSGWCSQEHRCLPLRSNSNMQVLCDKLLVGGIWDHGFVGLLNNHPSLVKSELLEALDHCSNPPNLSHYKRTVTESCRLDKKEYSLSKNYSSFDELDCRKTVDEFRTYLAYESSRSHHRIKDILLRTNDA